MPSGQVPIVWAISIWRTYIHLMHIVPGGAVPKLERAELLPVVLGGTVPRLDGAERLPSVLIRPLRELEREHHTPETEEYGIGSFVWRSNREDPRPFHPARLKLIMKGGGFGYLPAESPEAEELKGAFVGVVRAHGGGRGGEGVSAEAAEAFVKQLQADGRYMQELWG